MNPIFKHIKENNPTPKGYCWETLEDKNPNELRLNYEVIDRIHTQLLYEPGTDTVTYVIYDESSDKILEKYGNLSISDPEFFSKISTLIESITKY